MPGIQQQDCCGDDLIFGKPIPGSLCRHQGAQQVRPRRVPSLGDQVPYVFRELQCCRDGKILDLTVTACLIHRDHAVRPVQKLRRHLDRNAQQFSNDRHRDRCAVSLDQIVAFLQARCEFPCQRLDSRAQPLDPAGDEGTTD